MKVIVYSTKKFEKKYLLAANKNHHQLSFIAEHLSESSAHLADGFDVVCVFPNDDVSLEVIRKLKNSNVRYIALRAAGYDNIDVAAAQKLGITVGYVAEYSPYAVAEHTTALLLALNRKLILANRQLHQNNFKLDNLVGFDLNGKTVGIIGTGRIGSVVARIMNGFGCKLIAYDINTDRSLVKNYNLTYTDLETVCSQSDIITIHTPLTDQTRYLINKNMIGKMKWGVILINTSRGAVLDTNEIIKGLKKGQIGALGLDVYENEKEIFFFDRSSNPPKDEMLLELLSMNNVLVTPHQAFATNEALTNIATTTFYNIDCWAKNRASTNELTNLRPARKRTKMMVK